MTEKSSPTKSSAPTFKQWLWNSETKSFMGRNGASWLKLIVFYICFYTCLAMFWTCCLFLFYQTIDFHAPKWQQDDSRIGSNPGMGYRPRPPKEKLESTLIWFTSGVNGNYKHWVDDLESFVQPYVQDSGEAIGRGEAVASPDDCNAGKAPPPNKFCPFNYKDAFKDPNEQCTVQNKFGYDKGSPCVLLKINKIFGWVPKPYTKLPDNMPPNKGTNDGIVITCEGENPADKENIGPLRYTPSQTIKSNHFPYTNQPGYQSPFVMVQFKQPSRGVLINVECKAWAENIVYSRQEREGSVHFELLVD